MKIFVITSLIVLVLTMTGCTLDDDRIKLFGVLPVGKILTPEDDPTTPEIEGPITTKLMGVTAGQVETVSDLGSTFYAPIGWIGTVILGLFSAAQTFTKKKLKDKANNLESNYEGFQELVNGIEKFKTQHPEQWNKLGEFLATKLDGKTEKKIKEALNGVNLA